MEDSNEGLFKRIQIGPNVFDAAKAYSNESGLSEHMALTDITVGYLQDKYSKEMEENPNFVTIEGLQDGSAGIFNIIPGMADLEEADRGMPLNQIVHFLTDYQAPEGFMDHAETLIKQAPKAIGAGYGFGKGAALGAKAIPLAIATVGTPIGLITGGAVALAAGMAGAGVGHKVGEALSEPILGKSPEVLKGTEGKATTEAVRTFSDVMGGSVPAMFSKKVSNLAASSLVKKMSDKSGKKAIKTIDDAVNSFKEYARNNKGIYALSEGITAGGSATGAVIATELGYDEGWGRLGFEFVGGVGGSVGAAGLVKLLPLAFGGGKKAFAAGAEKLGQEAVEGSNKEARFFVEEFKKYAEDTNQMDELAETIEALDKGAFHALEMQKAVRKAMQEHPDKFTASQRKLLLEGEDIDLTTGQLAGDTNLSRMQRIVQEDNRGLQKQEEGQESLFNIITNLYLDELAESGDELKIAEFIRLHQAKLDLETEEVYRGYSSKFFDAQDKVFGHKPGEALDEAKTSTNMTEKLYDVQNKISERMGKLYEELPTDITVFRRQDVLDNINNPDSDQYPKYLRAFEEEFGDIQSDHIASEILSAKFFGTINEHRAKLGLVDLGKLRKVRKSDPLAKLKDKLIKEGSLFQNIVKNNDDPRFQEIAIEYLDVVMDKRSLDDKIQFFNDHHQFIRDSNKRNGIKGDDPRKKLEKLYEKSTKLASKTQSKLKDFKYKPNKGTVSVDGSTKDFLDSASIYDADLTFKDLTELRKDLLAKARETTNTNHARIINNIASKLTEDIEDFGRKLAKTDPEKGSAFMKANNFAKQVYDFLDRTFLGDILKLSNNVVSKDGLKEARTLRQHILDPRSDITSLNIKTLMDFGDFADKNLGLNGFKDDIQATVGLAYRQALANKSFTRKFSNEVRPRSSELPENTPENISQLYIESPHLNKTLISTEEILKDLFGVNRKGEKLLDSSGVPVKGAFSDLDLPQLNDLRDDLIKFGNTAELNEVLNRRLNKALREQAAYDLLKSKLGSSENIINIIRQTYLDSSSKSLTNLDQLFDAVNTLRETKKPDGTSDVEAHSLFKKSILKLLINHAKDSSRMSINGRTIDSAEKFYEILFGKLPGAEKNNDSLMLRALNSGAIDQGDFDRIKATAEVYKKVGEYEKLKKMSDLKDPSGLTDPSPSSMVTKFLGKIGFLKAASSLSKFLNTGTASLSIAGYFGGLSEKVFDRLPSQLKDELRNKVFTDPKLTSKLLKLSKAENRVETEAAEKDFVNAALQSLKEDYPAKLLGFFLGPVVTRMEGSIGREEAEENLLFMQQLKKLPALKDAFVEEAGEAATLVGQAAAPMAQDAIDGLRSGLSSVGNFVGNLSLPDLPNKSSGGANMNNLIRKASLPQKEGFLASLAKDSGIASLSKKPGEFDAQLYTELFENKNMG